VVFLDPYAPPPEPEAPEPEVQNEDEPNLNETGEDFEGQSQSDAEDSDDLDSEAGDQDEGLKTAAGPQAGQAEAAPEAAPAADPAAEPANQEGDRGDQGAEEPRITIAPPELVDPLGLADLELPNMAESNIVVLREKLAALGEVNLDAIREESEIKKTYDFYKTHYDDLVKAMRDLKTSISRINQTCRDRFSQTFELANRKFREIFPVLFEGGDGWLTLTDEFDPLESGVEIHVHPPGKKIMVMRSLSGGEKTLTSLCLIFALYLIKPSPFCLLDEADAPLDEANIDRFNKLLRNLAQASQIIMVTHNKRTMQIADMLYGVTMETPGVSKLVSVNLAEAEVLTHD
jgi:chromosome segregation protein